MRELLVLPFPSTEIIEGPDLISRGQRIYSLVCALEGEEINTTTRYSITFNNVIVYKCTFLYAITVDMIEAYDRVISVENSEWLKSVVSVLLSSFCKQDYPELQHLRICFDDGPCYEFICSGIEVEK